MNQTILTQCQAQQWDSLFETLSDLRFLETNSTKEALLPLVEALRHALYLATNPLPKDQAWRHSCGAVLARGYILRLSDILWRHHTDRSFTLFTQLYHQMLSEYPALAKHWAAQHQEPWLRQLAVAPPARAPLWRLSGLSPVFSPDKQHLLLRTSKALSLYDLDGRERRSFPTSYQGHGIFIESGRRLITWEQKTAQLWDVASLSPIATFGPHHANVFLAVSSPEDKLIALCSSQEISLWRSGSGESLLSPTRPPIEHDVQHIDILSDELLLIRNTGYHHYVWSWRTNQILWSYRVQHYILGVPSLSPGRDRLLLVDGEWIRCFAVPSGEELFSVKLSGGINNSIMFDETGERAIIAAWSVGAFIIDTKTGEIRQTIRGASTWKAGFVASGGFWLHSQRGVQVVDQAGEEVAFFVSPSTGGVDEYPVFSADGGHLLLQHNRTQTTSLHSLSFQPKTQDSEHMGEALSYGTRATPDGEALIVWRKSACSWFSLEEEAWRRTIAESAEAYLRQDHLLLTRQPGGGFSLYETQTGARRFSIPGHPEDPERWYLSKNKALIVDGQILLTSDGEHIKRWELETGAVLYEVEGAFPHYQHKVMRGECFLALLTQEKELSRCVYRVATGEEVQRFAGGEWSVLSPDGRWLATRPGYDDALVYEVATGALRYTCKDEGTISDAHFSEDSQSLYTWRTVQEHITSDPENVASEWSLTTGERTSRDKSFPSRPAVFIDGWSWTGQQLRRTDGEQIQLPHEMMFYHQHQGRHYMAGVFWVVFYVYEVML